MPNAKDNSRLKPAWKKKVHALYLGRELVHRFKHEAPDEEPILEAFQRARWALCIEYCPPEVHDKEKLQNTVRNLNRNVCPFLRFHQEGNGSRLRWELLLK